LRAWLLRLLAVRPDRTLLRLLAAMACLASATAWLHWGVARLEPLPGGPLVRPLSEPPSVESFGLRERPGRGRVVIGDGALVLESDGASGIVALDVHLAPRSELAGLRVVATLASEAILPAGDWRSGAHLRLVGRDREGRALYGSSLHLTRLVGSRAPFVTRRDVQLPPGSVAGTLVIELVRASGRLEVRDLTLLPLRDRPLFLFARSTLIAAWIVVVAWTLVRLLRSIRSPWLAAALGLGALVVIVLLVLPGATEQGLLALVAGLLGVGGVDPGRLGDAAHVLVFAGLALVASAAVREVSPWVVLLTLALAAPIAEYVQLLAEGRDVDPFDALRNLWGVAIGGALGLVLRRLSPLRARSARGRTA
jgi:hypothetical protein